MANLNLSNLTENLNIPESLNKPIDQIRRLPLGWIGGIFAVGLGLFAVSRIFPGGFVSRGFYQLRNLLPLNVTESDQSQAA